MVRWAQLEGDAKVLTGYAQRLGLPEGYQFCDVLSLEADVAIACGGPELADSSAILVIAPVHALDSLAGESFAASGQGVFIKQTIDNACGAIALLHVLLNTNLIKGSKLQQCLSDRPDPPSRGQWLEGDDGLAALHGEFAAMGATEQPDLAAETDLHFVAIVKINDEAVLFDGRRDYLVRLGGVGTFLYRTLAALLAIAPDSANNMAILALVNN